LAAIGAQLVYTAPGHQVCTTSGCRPSAPGPARGRSRGGCPPPAPAPPPGPVASTSCAGPPAATQSGDTRGGDCPASPHRVDIPVGSLPASQHRVETPGGGIVRLTTRNGHHQGGGSFAASGAQLLYAAPDHSVCIIGGHRLGTRQAHSRGERGWDPDSRLLNSSPSPPPRSAARAPHGR
jgi:hypothetical protein